MGQVLIFPTRTKDSITQRKKTALGVKRPESPHQINPEEAVFNERIQRIRASLEKINFLMQELKKTEKK